MRPQHFRTLPLVAAALLAAIATPARATLLSNLLAPGQTVQVGDLLFSNFTYLQVGDMPAANGITVDPFTTPGGDLGLTFLGSFLDLPGGNGSNSLIGYQVSSLAPDALITSATLSGNPSVIGGGGVASVTETFLPANPSDTMNIFSISPGSTTNTTTLSFGSGFSSLQVQDGVLALSTGGVPNFSFITPTFHLTSTPIPEPASVVLLGLGLGTMGLGYLRRKMTK